MPAFPPKTSSSLLSKKKPERTVGRSRRSFLRLVWMHSEHVLKTVVTTLLCQNTYLERGHIMGNPVFLHALWKQLKTHSPIEAKLPKQLVMNVSVFDCITTAIRWSETCPVQSQGANNKEIWCTLLFFNNWYEWNEVKSVSRCRSIDPSEEFKCYKPATRVYLQ